MYLSVCIITLLLYANTHLGSLLLLILCGIIVPIRISLFAQDSLYKSVAEESAIPLTSLSPSIVTAHFLTGCIHLLVILASVAIMWQWRISSTIEIQGCNRMLSLEFSLYGITIMCVALSLARYSILVRIITCLLLPLACALLYSIPADDRLASLLISVYTLNTCTVCLLILAKIQLKHQVYVLTTALIPALIFISTACLHPHNGSILTLMWGYILLSHIELLTRPIKIGWFYTYRAPLCGFLLMALSCILLCFAGADVKLLLHQSCYAIYLMAALGLIFAVYRFLQYHTLSLNDTLVAVSLPILVVASFIGVPYVLDRWLPYLLRVTEHGKAPHYEFFASGLIVILVSTLLRAYYDRRILTYQCSINGVDAVCRATCKPHSLPPRVG